MRCCVPTFLAGSLPDRIQRRTVSGFLPTRRAASGTVNIVVAYYYTCLAIPSQQHLQLHLVVHGDAVSPGLRDVRLHLAGPIDGADAQLRQPESPPHVEPQRVEVRVRRGDTEAPAAPILR